MDLHSLTPERWYHRAWGKAVIVLGIIATLFLGVILITTIRYWWQLRSGTEPAFIQEHYSRFTSVGGTGVRATAKLVDRRELETANDPYLGRPNAPLVISVFSDYTCPNSKLAAPILKRVAEKYGYGVKIIMRDFPVETLRPQAALLSQMAECAGQQGRYWQMHDALFGQQDFIPEVLTDTDYEQLALLSGTDYKELKRCATSASIVKEVRQDYLDGAKFGVAGTPTFFINGERVEGVVPFESWQKYLNAVLKK